MDVFRIEGTARREARAGGAADRADGRRQAPGLRPRSPRRRRGPSEADAAAGAREAEGGVFISVHRRISTFLSSSIPICNG